MSNSFSRRIADREMTARYMRGPLLAFSLVFTASVYADTASGIGWLTAQQAADGSWGVPAVAFSDTQEAIDAVRLVQGPNAAYYRGIAWLENHDPANNDGQSRKLGALTDRGDPTTAPLATLASSATISTAAASASGWGLGGSLEASPYDTALVLRTLSKQQPLPNMASAIAYLKATQLTGSGWEQIPGGGLDITTTAQVVRALAPFTAQDSSLTTVLAQASSALIGAVGSSASVKEKSLALIVLASQVPGATQSAQWRSDIQAAQLSDGSWEDDPFSTAIAMQALAISGSGNNANEYTVVDMPDPNLRAAINALLVHNAGDAITRGQLATITSLDLSNMGITNLEGLEYATHLTSLNLAGDSVGALSPVAGLMGLTILNIAGNPLSYWEDFDHDGFSDAAEQKYGLNPLNPDTDGDGIIDGSDPFPLFDGTPSNDAAPIANPDAVSTLNTTAITITPLTNDTDPDGDPLQLVDMHMPLHGLVQFTPGSNSIVYTPAPGYVGTDSFLYRITDGKGGFATSTVTVQDTRPDIPPVAVPDSVSARNRRGGGIVTAIHPVANDTDADGDTLTIVSVTQPANGTVALQSDGITVWYTPAAGFNGVDTFTYTISDGFGGNSTGTVTIQVRRSSFPMKYMPAVLQ